MCVHQLDGQYNDQ